jgi:hypothetical protein
MRRDQLEHAIRTACQIIGAPEVIVVGSQSILATYREDELPNAATMSVEVDILPIADSDAETERLAELIEGVAGELSVFEQTHGYSIDGVDMSTSALPEGWRSRLVKVQNANTAASSGKPQLTGWCLDKEDLCVAKLVALREKIRTSSGPYSTTGSLTPTSSLSACHASPSASTPAPGGQSTGSSPAGRSSSAPSSAPFGGVVPLCLPPESFLSSCAFTVRRDLQLAARHTHHKK